MTLFSSSGMFQFLSLKNHTTSYLPRNYSDKLKFLQSENGAI